MVVVATLVVEVVVMLIVDVVVGSVDEDTPAEDKVVTGADIVGNSPGQTIALIEGTKSRSCESELTVKKALLVAANRLSSKVLTAGGPLLPNAIGTT